MHADLPNCPRSATAVRTVRVSDLGFGPWFERIRRGSTGCWGSGLGNQLLLQRFLVEFRVEGWAPSCLLRCLGKQNLQVRYMEARESSFMLQQTDKASERNASTDMHEWLVTNLKTDR